VREKEEVFISLKKKKKREKKGEIGFPLSRKRGKKIKNREGITLYEIEGERGRGNLVRSTGEKGGEKEKKVLEEKVIISCAWPRRKKGKKGENCKGLKEEQGTAHRGTLIL